MRAPGSTGLPVPGYQVRITDENGRELPSGEMGDLWVRGDSNARCYWNRPRLTAERMLNGWFFSGDKYRADADGYYWYAGRSDDMFRVSGEWVSPIEVEGALIEHPAVLEAAVVARLGEDGLPMPCAFVTLKDPGCGCEGLAGDCANSCAGAWRVTNGHGASSFWRSYRRRRLEKCSGINYGDFQRAVQIRTKKSRGH